MTKHFRVRFGHKPDEFVSVDEQEVPMAIRAQITGKVGVFTDGTVSGNSIIAITPDYQRDMGWKRSYELTGEDYDEIGEGKVNEYRQLLATERSKALADRSGTPLQQLAEARRVS